MSNRDDLKAKVEAGFKASKTVHNNTQVIDIYWDDYNPLDITEGHVAYHALVTSYEAEITRLREALTSIKSDARLAQGDWAGVGFVYQPLEMQPLAEIEVIAAASLAATDGVIKPDVPAAEGPMDESETQ